jgi:hypothetical protein
VDAGVPDGIFLLVPLGTAAPTKSQGVRRQESDAVEVDEAVGRSVADEVLGRSVTDEVWSAAGLHREEVAVEADGAPGEALRDMRVEVRVRVCGDARDGAS